MEEAEKHRFARLVRHTKDLGGATQVYDCILRSKQRRCLYLLNLLVQMYARLGNTAAAQSVFDTIEQPNAFSWNILLAGYARNGHLAEAKQLFEQDMPARDIYAWNTLLAAYAHRADADQARQVFDRLPNKSLVSVNAMLQAHLAAGHLQEASGMFWLDMEQRDVVSWTSMVASYGQRSLGQLAKWLFDKMPQHGLVSWNAMLAAFAEDNENASIDLFHNACERNIITWNALLQACSVEPDQVFNKMPQWDAVSWNTVLATLVRQARVDEASWLFEAMPERTVVSWNSMISGYAEKGQLQRANATFQLCPRRDVVSWNSIVTAFAHHGHISDAKRIFHLIPARNVASWNTMLAACALKGYAQEAADMLQAMPEMDTASLNVVFQANALQRGNLSEAKRLFDGLSRRGVSTWTSMVVAYALNGQLLQAKESFYKMPQQDIVACNAMLSVFSQNGCADQALLAFKSMPNRDVVSWGTIIEAVAAKGRCVESMELYHSMLLEGTQPNDVVFLAMLNTCNHDVALVPGIWSSMVQDHCISPQPEHYGSAVDLLGRAGMLLDAKGIIGTMPVDTDAAVWRSLLNACTIHRDVELASLVAGQAAELGPSVSAPYVLLGNMLS